MEKANLKKILNSILVIAMILTIAIIPVSHSLAGTETYNHIIPFTITDTSGVARTNVPVIISYDVDGKLVAYGLTNATCTDTYVDSSGSGNSPVGSGTAYDYMMAADNITVVIPTLPAYGSYTVNLYTGYSPVQTSFPIILGQDGYITTQDFAAGEPGDNGSQYINAYLKDSGVLISKGNSIDVLYDSPTENITYGILEVAAYYNIAFTHAVSAGPGGWSGYFTANTSSSDIVETSATKFKITLSEVGGTFNNFELQVFNSGNTTWETVSTGSGIASGVTEKTFAQHDISALRYRFYSAGGATCTVDSVQVFGVRDGVYQVDLSATGVTEGEHEVEVKIGRSVEP